MWWVSWSLSSGRPLWAGPVGSPTLQRRKKIKEAERRQTCFLTSASCDAARVQAARARLSAFHRGSCCSERTPQLSSRYALPGTWSGARPRWFERPCALQRMMKDHASPAGVTLLSQSSELPRRPVIVPAGRNSRSRPGADCIGPRAGTALAPLSGVPSAEGVLHRADSMASQGPMSPCK